ncbi:MAG: HEAT repeat domain-containing protein [Planctomycetes bacterium]|nr:HEAT repeat domain-containing protein [Planctomycetota bacterium]
MAWRCILMIPLLVAFSAPEVHAGPLFRRSGNKPEPSAHVPALIKTLASDPDERKRTEAAEELREHDSKIFPEIVPALIEALKNDSSTSVRLEAVNALAKMRPITQPAVYAIEQAVANDSAFRVRATAKTILVQFSLLHGVKLGKTPEPTFNQTDEPPLAKPLPMIKPSLSSKIYGSPSTTPRETVVAKPVETSRTNLAPVFPTPLPVVAQPRYARSYFPTIPAKLIKSPPMVVDEGPSLNPPK